MHTLAKWIGCNLNLMMSKDLPRWPARGCICIQETTWENGLPHASAHSFGELDGTERVQRVHLFLRPTPKQLNKCVPPRSRFWKVLRLRIHCRLFGRTWFWIWAPEIVLQNCNWGIHLVLHFWWPTNTETLK